MSVCMNGCLPHCGSKMDVHPVQDVPHLSPSDRWILAPGPPKPCTKEQAKRTDGWMDFC